MEALRKLNVELAEPSSQQLYTAARKRGLDVTREQVKEVSSSTREIFRQPAPSSGKIAARGPRTKLQIDVIDYKAESTKENRGFKYVLIASEVFSRQIYTEIMRTKGSAETLAALKRILDRVGPVERVDSDQGNEFKEVEPYLKSKNIGYTVKESKDSLAVVDAAIGSFKEAVSRRMASKGSESWSAQVVPVTAARNKTPHSALRGDEPREVDTNPTVKFHALQDNARKIQQNMQTTESKKERLEEAGYFRALLPRSAWERKNRPKFGGDVLRVADIKGTSVKATNGKLFPLSSTTPVRESSKSIKIPRALQAGSAARDEKIATALAPFAVRLKNFMGSESQTIAPVARYMKSLPGWDEALKDLALNRAGGFLAAAKQMGITSSGEGGAIRIKVPVKRRITGKTKP